MWATTSILISIRFEQFLLPRLIQFCVLLNNFVKLDFAVNFVLPPFLKLDGMFFVKYSTSWSISITTSNFTLALPGSLTVSSVHFYCGPDLSYNSFGKVEIIAQTQFCKCNTFIMILFKVFRNTFPPISDRFPL